MNQPKRTCSNSLVETVLPWNANISWILVNLLEVQIDFELHYFAFEGGIEQICSKLVSTLANTLAIIVVHNKRVNRIGCQGFLAAVGLPFNTNSPSMAFSYSLFSSVKEVRVHGDIKRPNYYSVYLSVVQLYFIYKVEEAALFPGCSSARALNRSNQSLYKYACERYVATDAEFSGRHNRNVTASIRRTFLFDPFLLF